MAATDKMAMTREQMEALGGVITGNIGKAKVLTTDDYNWNQTTGATGTPDCIALWLLPNGLYDNQNGLTMLPCNEYNQRLTTITTILVMDGYEYQNQQIVNIIVPFSGVVQYYATYRDNGTKIYGYGDRTALTSGSVVDNLTSTSTKTPLSANQGKVLKDSIGDLTNLTTTDKTNLVAAINEAAAGGGSGPTVVQTTGTSTTDVMSQNAVTSMVFQDPATRLKVQIGKDSASQGTASTAVGYQSYASGNHSSAFGESASATGASSVAIGAFSGTSQQGVVAFGGSSLVTGYNNSQYRLLTGVYDGQSAHDAATVGQAVGTTETYTIATSDWSALSASSPYDYQATVTATYTIGANTIAELLNDSPVDFATHGFAIGSISSQSVTIYSIGQPSASVSLKVNYKG